MTKQTNKHTIIATHEFVVPRSIPITSPESLDDCHRTALLKDDVTTAGGTPPLGELRLSNDEETDDVIPFRNASIFTVDN